MFSGQAFPQNSRQDIGSHRQNTTIAPVGLFASPTTCDAPNRASSNALGYEFSTAMPVAAHQKQQPQQHYQPQEPQPQMPLAGGFPLTSLGKSCQLGGTTRKGLGVECGKYGEELGIYDPPSSGASSPRCVNTTHSLGAVGGGGGGGRGDGGEVAYAENDTHSTATGSTGTYELTHEVLSEQASTVLNPVAPHAERVAVATMSDCEAWNAVTNRDWYPDYHVAAFANWLSVPGGLCFHNGDYHVFYQHHPFGIEWGPMHWGHAISKDLVHWQHLPVALAPGDAYDRDGCFSGSAVSYKGKLYLFYTGHTWFPGDGDSNIYQMQCLAVSDDGIHFDKKGPVLRPPPKYRHCRDPKVWQREDGVWCMVLGARDTAKDLGQLLLYTTDDLSRWNEAEFTVVGRTEDRNTFMWECPDFFPYRAVRRVYSASGQPHGGAQYMPVNPPPSSSSGAPPRTYALLFCPQGLLADRYRNRNRFQAGTLLGHFVVDTPTTGHSSASTEARRIGQDTAASPRIAGQAPAAAPAIYVSISNESRARFVVTRQFREIDYGTDFYAPQSFVAPDGRRIVVAWMDMWASPMPSREHGWSGALTIPRELVITEEGEARMLPIRELESLRRVGIELRAQELEGNSELPLVEDCTAYEVEVTFNVERSTSEKYGLWLGSGAEIYVDAQSERLVVNRHYPEYMLSGNRSCPLPDGTELRLRVFFDRSSMEVFVNDGEACFSTRIYPNANDRALRLFSINGAAALLRGKIWQLGSGVVEH